MAVAPHTALSVFKDGAQLTIQPKALPGVAPASTVETLSLNLDTGKIQVSQAPPQQGSAQEVLALLGLCKLHAGNALVVVTAARPVAQVRGHDVFEVADAQLITSNEVLHNRANRGLLRLLADAIDPHGSGRGLHFSYTLDLTMTQQHAASLAATDPHAWAAQVPVQRADGRFFWNKAIAAPLVSAGASKFVQPCIVGFVEQLTNLHFNPTNGGPPVTATLTLLARRQAARAGTRQWRRGADSSGHVANFVETEQVLSIDGPTGHPLTGTTCAYVIVRGSIPLLWTQLPNIKYKPTTVIAPSDVSGSAHDKHFEMLVDQYRSVVAINLISHHGTEGKLEAAFRAEAARLCTSDHPISDAMRYVAFDFHHECGGRRYHRLSVLWDQVADDFRDSGFFRQDGPLASSVVHRQSGVMRVNCIDCLDRTNVVQGVLARKSLEAILTSLGLLPQNGTLPEAYPQVEREFKILWADHGDTVSTQYAGTGAMKSGFTRTGKRTIGGVIDDGWKAVVRYYLNNFSDGGKQDAIDLLTGAYTCDTINTPPIKPQPSAMVPLLISLMALGLTAHNLVAVLGYYSAVSRGLAPAPEVIAATDPVKANGLLSAARSLLSTVMFTAPDAVLDGSKAAGAGDAAVSAAGLSITPTAASMAETGIHVAGNAGGVVSSLAAYVLLPLLLGVGLVFLVVKNGKYLVNKPQLCPQLAVTVQKQGRPVVRTDGKQKSA